MICVMQGYDISFLITNFHCEDMFKHKLIDFVVNFMEVCKRTRRFALASPFLLAFLFRWRWYQVQEYTRSDAYLCRLGLHTSSGWNGLLSVFMRALRAGYRQRN